MNMIHIFWVVCYDQYYPDGGLANVKRMCQTLEIARLEAQKHLNYDYVQIYDNSTSVEYPLETIQSKNW